MVSRKQMRKEGRRDGVVARIEDWKVSGSRSDKKRGSEVIIGSSINSKSHCHSAVVS